MLVMVLDSEQRECLAWLQQHILLEPSHTKLLYVDKPAEVCAKFLHKINVCESLVVLKMDFIEECYNIHIIIAAI